ncbi:hypothetical protein [Kitasatospora sp. NPDC056531]|uniref:hypothetical protein n=1 Tax=Kitasatospora sp. NPDC056531 TaxID=3345856 RepID=UPI00369BD77A
MKSVKGSLFVTRYNDSGVGLQGYYLLDHVFAAMQEREPFLVADESPMTQEEINNYCSTARWPRTGLGPSARWLSPTVLWGTATVGP